LAKVGSGVFADDRIRERLILLRKMFEGLTILAIGRDLRDAYCLRFDEKGYDASYSYYHEEEAIERVARMLTDEQLLQYVEKYAASLRTYWRFDGKYYTYDPEEKRLSLESNWPDIQRKLEAVRQKHGRAAFGVLKAYVELRRDWSAWSECDYSQLEYRSKELGGEGWRRALIALEVAGIVAKRGSGRRPGERSIALEVIPLIQSVLESWKGEYAETGEPKGKVAGSVAPSDLWTRLSPNMADIEWDPELVQRTAAILNLAGNDVMLLDNVMQTTTKLVEARLRFAVSRFIKGEIVAPQSYGLKLLEFARKVRFIQSRGNEPEPIYYLLRWFFLERRNTFHHLFSEHKLAFVISNLVISDLLLKEIEYRATGPRPLHIPITTDKSKYSMGEPMEVRCEIKKVDGSLFEGGDVIATVQLPPGIQRECHLAYKAQGVWSGVVQTVDAQPGTASITVIAVDSSGKYMGGSASIVSISSP